MLRNFEALMRAADCRKKKKRRRLWRKSQTPASLGRAARRSWAGPARRMSREFRPRGAKKMTQAQLAEALHEACEMDNVPNALM